jgi:hypothetical protein
MNLLKLKRCYLNLEHITSVSVTATGVEVVTPYEVLRLKNPDAGRVLRAVERLARETEERLELPRIEP